MSKPNNDISSLFKHLGTSSEHYQEIGRSNEARESEARWPLLASIHELANVVPAAVPDVLPPSAPDTRAEDVIKHAAPITTAPSVDASPRQERSIAVPATLHAPAPAVETQTAPRPTPAVSMPQQAASAQTPVASAQAQASAIPLRTAEFIAPRPKSLVASGHRGMAAAMPTAPVGHAATSAHAAPLAHPRPAPTQGPTPTQAQSVPAPLEHAPTALVAPDAGHTRAFESAPVKVDETGTQGTQIESMFARLAKPKGSPELEQPVEDLAPAPAAAEPKRSLFERLIRK